MGTMWLPDTILPANTKYLSVLNAIRTDIQNGTLKPKEKLPPVRELAWAIKVTPGTIARAYKEGINSGLLSAQIGRGTFVNDVQPKRTEKAAPFYSIQADINHDGMINLGNANTANVGQAAEMRNAMISAANTYVDHYCLYPEAEGRHPIYPHLVNWMNDWGVTAKEKQIIMTYGGQNALSLVAKAIRQSYSGKFAIESLCYPGIRHAIERGGGQLVSIEVDHMGMVPEALEKICKTTRISAVFLSANVLNPETGQMPIERRKALTQIAQRYDLQVVEDDCWSIGAANLPSFLDLCANRAWYISSLSKTVSAGLRFGWVVTPETQTSLLQEIMRNLGHGVSRAVSDVAYELLKTGDADRIRNRILSKIANSVSETVNMLGKWDIKYRLDVPFIWVHLPKGWRVSTFVSACAQQGIMVRSADEFSIEGVAVPHSIRISVNTNIGDAIYADALNKISTLLANPPTASHA